MSPDAPQPVRTPAGPDTAALANNVLAAVGMADVIRTTLGPRGLDKLLVDQLGNRVITNDGYTVLVSLKTSHPVSRLLVEIAERQELSVGDGTTSTVIMAAEMLREGYRVTSEYGIHPSKLLAELDEGVAVVSEFLHEACIPVPSLKDPLVGKVLRTATASKLDGTQLSGLILSAVNHLGSGDRDDLRHGIILLRRPGDDLFIDGIAIEHLPQETGFVHEIGHPRICLVKDALRFPLPGVEAGEEAAGKDPGREQRDAFLARLLEKGVNVVVTNAPEIDHGLRIALAMKRVALIRVSTEELGLLSRSLDTPELYGAQVLAGPAVPSLAAEGIELDEEKGLTVIRAPGSGVVATLIIGGATAETSKERTRTCIDGISGVHFALKGGVVAGGGIAELNAARFLERTALGKGGGRKAGFELVIKGLESVSRQILENAGYNGYEMMTRLRTQEDGIGIDLDTGEFIPMVENGILDPLITKLSGIQIAAHIAKTVLKIDRNLVKDEVHREAGPS
ncbi:MAG TPA: TCP-1/cpn60 chaperonin family protein [Methanomicrobiales archaeon]|nr:TCP-1/cpn60 chaperonin family protein [Methanomicrobiales archaeon]